MKRTKGEELAGKIQQLEAAGCPTMSRARHWLRIRVTDEPVLRELDGGLTACIIPVSLSNGAEESVITDVELNMGWEDRYLHWLEDPDDSNYRFPGKLGVYAREEVLNHFILDDGILEPGEQRSGLLLAIGYPIPPLYRQNEFIEATLAIHHQFGDADPIRLRFKLIRSLASKARPANERVGKGLFEGGEKLSRSTSASLSPQYPKHTKQVGSLRLGRVQ